MVVPIDFENEQLGTLRILFMLYSHVASREDIFTTQTISRLENKKKLEKTAKSEGQLAVHVTLDAMFLTELSQLSADLHVLDILFSQTSVENILQCTPYNQGNFHTISTIFYCAARYSKTFYLRR